MTGAIGLSGVGLTRGDTRVFSNASLDIGERGITCVLGGKESGKTSLVELLTGAVRPTEGRVKRPARPGPPIGKIPYFDRRQTIRNNIRYVARIHRLDERGLAEFVDRIVELGPALDERMDDAPPPLRSGILFTLSYLLPRSALVIDEGFAPTSLPLLRERFVALLRQAATRMPVVLTTRRPDVVRLLGERIVLITDAGFEEHATARSAILAFKALNAAAPPGDEPEASALSD